MNQEDNRKTGGCEVLRINRLASPVSVLGPFERAGIWVQGCPFRCPGCILPEGLEIDGGEEYAAPDLASWVLSRDGIEGITLSGGEPMAQTVGLVRLLELVRAEKDLGVVCYTGYTLEFLERKGSGEQKALLEKVDLLIDGPYVRKKHADLLWRGSENQRLIHLSDRYRGIVEQLLIDGDQSAGLELRVSSAGDVSFIGVPDKPGMRERIKSAIDPNP